MRFRWFLYTFCLLLAACAANRATDVRVLDLRWTVRATGIPEGARRAQLWIALPQSLPEQAVRDLRVDCRAAWDIVTDPDFHNRLVRVRLDDPPRAFAISLSARIERRPVDGPVRARLSDRALYLREEALVGLGPRIRAIADSIGDGDRARYDYVLDRMDYDKSVPGWGFGDSERACDVGKGNCTDFHSLFMSLSRVKGVPAVFEMGYATRPSGESNRDGGYHCWAWFYRDGAWTPVDISEADQHPDKADFFFGRLDADRITFSRGRDVVLPGMEGAPLNYVPAGGYLEVDGRPAGEITRTLSYTVR